MKLRGSIGGKPLTLPLRHQLNLLLVLISVLFGAWFVNGSPEEQLMYLLIIIAIAGLLGIHMIMAIGGADMPVVVSMLNSYSGWAAASAGFMLSNDLLIITGALVGSSGAGKSTFVDLIPRLYDIHNGEISVDGVNIKEISLFSLRSLMGIVTQETILFNYSIINNIRYGDDAATIDQIKNAAKAANALEFIEEMDDGFETVIGEKGTRLSGGQRQRITIARAILKNPDILILDEATSALDSESERKVQIAIDNLVKNRTVIVIAHRLSTIENADKILVFDHGEIVEMGSHSELIKMNGKYSSLYEIQKRAN